MIAMVRIAPVEKWCEYVKIFQHQWSNLPIGAEVGMAVGIDTATMQIRKEQPQCLGKEWKLTEPSVAALLQRIRSDAPVEPMWICEHMLEMD